MRGQVRRRTIVLLVMATLLVGTASTDPLAAQERTRAAAPPRVASAPTADGASPIRTFADSFHEPTEIVTGADGNLWLAAGGATIWRMTPAGVSSPFTANGVGQLTSLAVGADGNVWFTDDGGKIGKVTPAGAISLFTGPGIDRPASIIHGRAGTMWFVNRGLTQPWTIGTITTTGTVSAYTGSGVANPWALAAGPDGTIWVVGTGSDYAHIAPAGAVTTFTNSQLSSSLAVDDAGNLWFAKPTSIPGNDGFVAKVSPTGAFLAYAQGQVNRARGITLGPDGNIWYTDYYDVLVRITADGQVSRFPNKGAVDVTAGPDGNLWVTSDNSTIVRVAPTGTDVSTIRGTAIDHPTAVATDPDGSLWFSNAGDPSIGHLLPDGTVARFPYPDLSTSGGNSGGPWLPDLVVGPDGNLWFTNSFTIVRLTPAGTFTVFPVPSGAGNITAGADGALWFTHGFAQTSVGRITTSGAITMHEVTGPEPLTVDTQCDIVGTSDGLIWLTTRSGRLASITTAGAFHALSEPGDYGFDHVVAGPGGTVWAQDRYHQQIGRVTTTGAVSLVGVFPMLPSGIAPGSDGSVWFTDQHRIVRLTTGGDLSAFPLPALEGEPLPIAAGADGIWFRHGNYEIGFVATDAPTAPRGVQVVAGPRRVRVTWQPPASDGGHPITRYTVTASPGGATCTWTAGPLTCTVSGLTNDTAYSLTVRAESDTWQGPPSTPTSAVPVMGGDFHPLAPARILDSRTPNGGWTSKLTAGSPRDLQVTGTHGGATVPASATAVVMNVTVTGASAGSFVSTWPAGTPPPATSTLNFGPGETIANLTTTMVGAGGRVSFANAVGAVDVVADLVGYYDDGTGGGGALFTGITPTRMLDSRFLAGGWAAERLPAGPGRALAVRQPAAAGGVPATATAIVANVTVTNATAGSFLSVWPSGSPPPGVSTVNFAPDQTIPNLAIVKIGDDGSIMIANAVGAVHVIVDVVGYFDPTGGSTFHPLGPRRFLDTRTGQGLDDGPSGPHSVRTLPIAGNASPLPPGSTGMVANMTVTNGTAGSFVTVFPGDVARPNSSNLNFAPHQTIANLVTVAVPPSGVVAVSNEVGEVDLVGDLIGYYAPG
jgi:streptogramin lyase